MHILKPDGTLEEISDKKNFIVQLIESFFNRPKKQIALSDGDLILWRFYHLLAITLIIFILSITIYNIVLSKYLFQNNYCEVTVVGHGGTVWQKCQSK